MEKTVIALYDNVSDARNALEELVRAGYDRDQMSLVANDKDKAYVAELEKGSYAKEGAAAGAGTGAAIGGVAGILAGLGGLLIPGIGPVVAAGPLVGALAGAGMGAASGGLVGGLVGMGIPEEEAKYYAEGLRRGGVLLLLRTDESREQEAIRIMNLYNPVDLGNRVGEWQASGWTGFDESAETTDSTTAVDRAATQGRQLDDQITMPVIEEELKVGKRVVEQGHVRVQTKVEEIPVEERVTLREERINVERRSVDRVVTGDVFDQFEEGSVRVAARAEEAVVAKEARVVEEVVIQKQVGQRTEHITDTVRRTNVEVERTGAQQTATRREYEDYDSEFRDDFNRNYASSGLTYSYYQPAYRYGYDLRTSDQYGNRTWDEIEPEARRHWEGRNPGTWQQFKNSVRHAWQKVTS